MKPTGTVALLLLLASCSGQATLTGTWNGSSTSGWAFSFTMVETGDGVITGNGTLALGNTVLPMNIIGAHAHPGVSLTLDAARLSFAPVSFQGSLRADLGSIKGILINQTVFIRDSVTFTRTTATFAPRILEP